MTRQLAVGMIVEAITKNELNNKSCIIYGASTGGLIISKWLTGRTDAKILSFCDRKKAGQTFCNLSVIRPDELKSSGDACIIISLMRSFSSAVHTLEEQGVSKVYYISDIVDDLKHSEQNIIFQEIDQEKIKTFISEYPVYASAASNNRIILPALELFITERCSLRCRDCSHFIPMYEQKADHDLGLCISSLNTLTKYVDGIIELVILGGESFLYNELCELLYRVRDNKKISFITVLTNGTVMPNAYVFNALSETNARVRISDYGKLSPMKDEIYKVCNEFDIGCFVEKEKWVDMGRGERHFYREDEMRHLFSDCPFSQSLIILKGRLYRCPHSAHIHDLFDIPGKDHDSIDLSEMEDDDLIKKRLSEFIRGLPFLFGCEYCNGGGEKSSYIEPAIQM